MSSSVRRVVRLIKAISTKDEAGVSLFRSLGSRSLPNLDPFLLFDAFGSDDPDEYIAGFPNHPHRGFETVTYMIEGQVRHKDSKGNEGVLKSGGVQWMTAGAGVIHSEMPEQVEGRMFGFQLWANLPNRLKMCEPRYQNIPAEQIPDLVLSSGVRIHVLAGSVVNHDHDDDVAVTGPITGISVDPTYLDIALPPNTSFSQALPLDHRAFVYGVSGAVGIGNSTVQANELGVLSSASPGDGTVELRNVDDVESGRVLLIAGRPIGEPIVHVGPFVMCTMEEIKTAFQEYRNGTFVKE